VIRAREAHHHIHTTFARRSLSEWITRCANT
jgi:hypothetical protein